MDERQLVCYPRSGTCSLMGSVCCVVCCFGKAMYRYKAAYTNRYVTAVCLEVVVLVYSRFLEKPYGLLATKI